MSQETEHFSNELDALIERFRHEYDITYAEMTGALQMKIFLLNREAEQRQEKE